jgi:hypothetical protein
MPKSFSLLQLAAFAVLAVVLIAALVIVLDLFPGGGRLLVELAQALAPVVAPAVAREKIRLVSSAAVE